MRIFIDARMRRRGGTFTYATSLLKSLLTQDIDENHYVVLYAPGQQQIPDGNATRLVAPSNNPYHWLLWEKTSLQRLLREQRVDLLHGLRRPLNAGPGIKTVQTIHSAYPYLYPEMQSLSDKLFWTRVNRSYARRADGVLAVSDEDRGNLIKCLGLDERKVFSHPLAPPGTIGRVDDEAAVAGVLRKYGIEAPYYLYIGSYYLFKNIPGIIRAYAKVKQDGSRPHRLVLVGQPGSASEAVRRAVAESGQADNIVETGGLSDDHDLSCLYSGASAFLFPTQYDSFGFPVLEAMACGTPVIASTIGALPEVAGDAALLADPDDTDEIASYMRDLVDNRELREEMIARGTRRVAEFSWERCARRVLEVYRTVMEATEGPD